MSLSLSMSEKTGVCLSCSATLTQSAMASMALAVCLREAGEVCGKHQVERIMQEHKVKAVRGYEAP